MVVIAAENLLMKLEFWEIALNGENQPVMMNFVQ